LSSGIEETVVFQVATDQEILIQTYDYSGFGQSDFTITINCPIPDNDDCGDAITLSVNNVGACPANQVEGTTYGASASNPDACESNSSDVYYTFNSGSNTAVIINLEAITATDLVLSVFEESCGSTAFFCAVSTSQSAEITVDPSTTYYVRVHSFFAESVGSFNICVEAVAPDFASLNGSINGWNNSCAARDIQVSMVNVSGGVNYIGLNSTLNPDGSFALVGTDIIPGTYDILVNVDGGLAKLLENVVISSGSNGITVSAIVLGDLNNNNVINVTDYSLLGAAFGSVTGDANFSFRADLNCNGAVNVTDLSILGLGFGQSGDSLPL